MTSLTESSSPSVDASLALNRLIAEQARRRRLKRQMAEIARDADAVRDRCRTLKGFLKESWHVLEPDPYVESWHQDASCDHLEAASRGEIQRLEINQPPGTMKSTTVAVTWNPWEWTKPELRGKRFFSTSWANDYAVRDSRRSRDLIQSEWYQALWPDVVLLRDNEADFENTARGYRKAKPFMSLTAGRGNRLIIDDPQSTEQAESVLERDRARRIFRESATSRLNDPARDVIVVMQHRLHPEDICGLIEELGLPYVKLILPMEYVASTTVVTKWFKDPRTVDGELLCPARIPRETVEQNKIELGPHAYDTQYQQQARARDGSYFFAAEHLLVDGKPVPMPPRCDAIYAIVDTAVKEGKKRDGTGVAFYALHNFPEPHLEVLDWDIEQMKGSVLIDWLPGIFARCEELAVECRARMGVLGVWIEDKGSGTILLQQTENMDMQTHALDGVIVAAGKEGRAVSVSGYVYTGKVKITELAYNKTKAFKGHTRNHFFYQVTGFQVGKGVTGDEDDLFDTFTYGVAVGLGNADGV